MNIAEAIQKFERYVTTERRLSPTTTRYYVGEVQRFATYLSDQKIVDTEDIASRDVRSWQMSLIEAGEAPGTVTKQVAALRAWFKYLRRQGIVERDVMAKVTPPRMPKRLPIFFRESEVEHIYDDIYPDNYTGEVEKMVLRLLYETGMRRSELAGLTLGSIDFAALTIKVLGKRNKERYIPIEAELAHALTDYIGQRAALLETLRAAPESDHGRAGAATAAGDRLLVNAKGRPLGTQAIYKIVDHYMSQLSSAERTSPHIFRHTFATHMLNEGASIDALKELLGHSDLAATEVYTHVTREHLKESYKQAHPRAIKK